MADDVVRGSIVLNKGVTTWPPNPPISVAAAAPLKKGAVAELEAAKNEVNPFKDGMKQALTYTGSLGTISQCSWNGFTQCCFYKHVNIIFSGLYRWLSYGVECCPSSSLSPLVCHLRYFRYHCCWRLVADGLLSNHCF